MKRPPLSLTALSVFWLTYGSIAAVTLYRSLAPLNRELLVILGSFTVVLVITTIYLLKRPKRAVVGEKS